MCDLPNGMIGCAPIGYSKIGQKLEESGVRFHSGNQFVYEMHLTAGQIETLEREYQARHGQTKVPTFRGFVVVAFKLKPDLYVKVDGDILGGVVGNKGEHESYARFCSDGQDAFQRYELKILADTLHEALGAS